MYDVGNAIRQRRKFLKITVKKLAEMMGLTPNTVGRYESGEIDISITKLNEIATLLNTTPQFLMGVPETPEGMREVPVMYYVKGNPWDPVNTMERLKLDDKFDCDFVIRVDSEDGLFTPGSLVMFKKTPVTSGTVCVVHNGKVIPVNLYNRNGEEFYTYNDQIFLKKEIGPVLGVYTGYIYYQKF